MSNNKNSPTRSPDGYSVASASASINTTLVSRQTYSDIGEEQTFLSPIEQAILRSNVPIEIDETEEISALGVTGTWANKSESINWESHYKLSDYSINEDMNPQIITKKINQNLEYVQELAFRYLKPPTPPVPGDIIIKQEPSLQTPPAPPLIIRQQPPRPSTPEPLIIREYPPKYPDQIGQKIITISGKKLPPPPRKVVIERLAKLPIKPQSVIVERWLPYNSQKRRVIHEKPRPDPEFIKPRNIIIQWDPPSVSIKQEVKHLDIIRADPNEYYQRYGSTLTHHSELPDYVRNVHPPDGIQLAADHLKKASYELEGDLEALHLIDLDQEGLSEYKTQLSQIMSNRKNISDISKTSDYSLYEVITNEVDVRDDDEISMSEAERIFSRLNENLQQKKSIKKKDLEKFLVSNLIDDEKVDLNQYRDAFNKFSKLNNK